ncbi:MAG: biotin--[acetyl-CoA-carboxylase] ligase [Sporichthyaceae bacterium]
MAPDTNVNAMIGPEEPLDAAVVRAALPDGPWELHLLAETNSTNADVGAAAAAGDARPGYLVVAEHQRAGRGRHGRTWLSPPGAGLTFSLLVAPEHVPAARWGWIPLLTGVAMVDATTGLGATLSLKWPNDCLDAAGAKVAGILVERVATPTGPMAVIGIGINVHGRGAQLPIDKASSLEVAGATGLDRARVLAAVLAALRERFEAWHAVDGDPSRCGLGQAYRTHCATLGAQVRIDQPGGTVLTGSATDVAQDGALVVSTPAGAVTVAAGDVTHLRGVS